MISEASREILRSLKPVHSEGLTFSRDGEVFSLPYHPLLLDGEWTPGLRECHRRFKLFENILDKDHPNMPRTAYMDVGHNCGYFLKRFSETFPGVTGIETDEHYIRLFAQLYPDLELASVHEDVNNDGWEDIFEPSSYNLITALSMIEYVWDREGFLSKVYALLAPGGVFILEGHSMDIPDMKDLYYDDLLRQYGWLVDRRPELTDPGKNAPALSPGRPVWVCSKL